MCGIAGIISFEHDDRSFQRLERMCQRLSHRGPDDEGFALVGEDRTVRLFAGDATVEVPRRRLEPIASAFGHSPRVSLCHRRFAIMDPTAAGHQPWYDEEGHILLVFNGEIYNFLELRNELVSAGFGPFQSNSDTEVVAAAYRAWGVRCFERFNGFWSIAIVDISRWRVIFSRDRFGKKPLYFVRNGRDLIFSSEIRSLLVGQNDHSKTLGVNHDAAALYLVFDRRNTLRDCLWDDVEMLPPGSFSEIDLSTGAERRDRYWRLDVKRRSESEVQLDQAVEEFSQHLADSVKLRMRADVPIAANLSGGMDSSSIVAHAQRVLGDERRLETNTMFYQDAPELDERPFASAVAEHVSTNHIELEVSSEQTWEYMDELIEAFEEPVHSAAFMTQWLGWRAIRDRGTKVILHGAAADEIFAGYPYHPDIDDYASLTGFNLKRYLSARPIWDVRAQLRTAKWFGKGRVWPSVSNPLRKAVGLPDRRIFNRNYDPRVFQRWYSPDLLAETTEVLGEFNEKFLSVDHDLASRLQADMEWLRVPFWVNAMDKAMMQIPVEVRMPFLDYKLVEYVFSLPVSYIYRHGWTKYILRLAVKDLLPESIVWRKTKVGFTVPKSQWLEKHHEYVQASLTDNRRRLSSYVNVDTMLSNLSAVPSDILWRSVNFAKWLEIFHPAGI